MRLSVLQKTYGLKSASLNAWCRERGIFIHQLEQWKSQFCKPGYSSENREDAMTMLGLKVENQKLESELSRKEKAWAKAAALSVLQKNNGRSFGADKRPGDD